MRNHIAYKGLQENRGLKRIWLQGQRLTDYNFRAGEPVSIIADEAAKTVTVTLAADGDRIVASRKKSNGDLPIIDIENRTITRMYQHISKLKIEFFVGRIVVTIHPDEKAKTERLERLNNKLKKGCALSTGSACHGSGVLDSAVHKGLLDEGLVSQLDFAIEINDIYLDTSLRNNRVWSDTALAINGPMESVELAALPQVDCLLAGLPCTGASRSGRTKNQLKHAEDHNTAGSLFFSFLAICKAVNPSIIILENVPEYSTTASMSVIRATLEQWGYELHETTLNGVEMGALENRNRLVVVAATHGIDIDMDTLVPVQEKPETLSEILDDVLLSDPSWRDFNYLIEKEAADKIAGKGFKMQILDSGADQCGVIGRGYQKGRSTEPKLQHPLDSRLMRLFTPAEHARIKGIPENLVDGCSATIAHEILGQSVVYPKFRAVGRTIARCLKEWLEKLVSPALPSGQMSIWDLAA